MLSQYYATLNEFKYAIRPPLYITNVEQNAAKKTDIKLMDSAHVIHELPKGIPFVDEPVDLVRQSRINKAVRGLRVLLFHDACVSKCLPKSPEMIKAKEAKLAQQISTFFESALENQMVFFLHRLEKKKKGVDYVLKFDFPNVKWKDIFEPLGTRVFLRNVNIENRRLQIRKITFDNKDYKPTHPDFPRILKISMCSFSTLIIMKMHFLFCHLLCGMGIYNTARRTLDRGHPILQLMYPHGHQINQVNLSKGATLISECFGKDFSFSNSELRPLFTEWMKDYDIAKMTPNRLSKLRLGDAKDNLLIESAMRTYETVRKYVETCVTRMYSNDQTLAEDKAMCNFLTALGKLPFRSTFELPKSKKFYTVVHLTDIISSWLFVSVYMHFENGDQGKALMKTTQISVPKKGKDCHIAQIQSKQGKTFFNLIFESVIKPTYLLKENEWIQYLPRDFQVPAKEFQKQLIAEFPKMELGINK